MFPLKNDNSFEDWLRCIGVVDRIALRHDNLGNEKTECSAATKVYFQNFRRPSPTILIRHWNEEKREELKVRHYIIT